MLEFQEQDVQFNFLMVEKSFLSGMQSEKVKSIILLVS